MVKMAIFFTAKKKENDDQELGWWYNSNIIELEIFTYACVVEESCEGNQVFEGNK